MHLVNSVLITETGLPLRGFVTWGKEGGYLIMCPGIAIYWFTYYIFEPGPHVAEADLKLLWSLGMTLSYRSSCSASQMLEVQMCVPTPRCGLATQDSGHRNLYLPCSGVMVGEDRTAHYSPARTLKCLPSLGTENALKGAVCVLQPHTSGCHTSADKSVSWIQSTCDAFHFSNFS